MGWEERVDLTPEVLAGKPVVKSTRLSVKLILDLLADGWSSEEVLEQYPTLARDDVLACLHYAS